MTMRSIKRYRQSITTRHSLAAGLLVTRALAAAAVAVTTLALL